jgi:hypothetical protein
MDQEKNRGGRPPKLRTQEEIDKLKGTAKEYAQRTRGESVDRELEVLLPVLREQVQQQFPGLLEGERRGTEVVSYCINDWLAAGQTILRSEAYGKTCLDFATEEDREDEEGKTFEDRLYADCFIDALANEFVGRAQKHHLSSPLVQFVIRVIEAALTHGRKLPAGGDVQRKGLFFRKEELAEYLAELKQSGDSYREPPKPPKAKGKPGPKPKQIIFEHAGSGAYISPDEANAIRQSDPFL